MPTERGGVPPCISYRIVSATIHQPALLRWVGALIRRWPVLETNLSVVARDCAARHVFGRPASYSSTTHAPNLVAGCFVIGMEAGPRHAAERAYAQAKLPSPGACGLAALEASRLHIQELARSHPLRFDLIEDYMLWVAWAGMRGIFGSAAGELESTQPRDGAPVTARAAMRAFFEEMRHPGAHLLVGKVAPADVRRRAIRSARALRRRVHVNLPALRKAWGAGPDALLKRTATGLLWVGHPATTQSGALVMQELLGRRGAYDSLHRTACGLKAAAWEDSSFRNQVREHVLEALRLRPPFPLLLRDVPRDTAYEAEGDRRVATKAGKPVTLITAAAMADPDALRSPAVFRPGRSMPPAGPHHLLFGHGPRTCIGADHVVEILTSAMVGLMTLPPLRWAGWLCRMRYDGPIVVRMRLEARR